MPVLGISGNPVSALVSVLMFLRPAIAAMLGLPADPLFEEAVLGSAMPENHIREDYVRARIERCADAPEGTSIEIIVFDHLNSLY